MTAGEEQRREPRRAGYQRDQHWKRWQEQSYGPYKECLSQVAEDHEPTPVRAICERAGEGTEEPRERLGQEQQPDRDAAPLRFVDIEDERRNSHSAAELRDEPPDPETPEGGVAEEEEPTHTNLSYRMGRRRDRSANAGGFYA